MTCILKPLANVPIRFDFSKYLCRRMNRISIINYSIYLITPHRIVEPRRFIGDDGDRHGGTVDDDDDNADGDDVNVNRALHVCSDDSSRIKPSCLGSN